MGQLLEQHKNALGKYLEGMVLEALKEEHAASLPQMHSTSEPLCSDSYNLAQLRDNLKWSCLPAVGMTVCSHL